MKVAPNGLCVSPLASLTPCSLRFWRYLRGRPDYSSQPLAVDAIRVLRDLWLEQGAP